MCVIYWEQYQLYAQGKPVNELIVALAGVGVGLTAARLSVRVQRLLQRAVSQLQN